MTTIYDKFLDSEKPIFNNEYVLDFNYLPDNILHRDSEQEEIAASIAPLAKDRSGSNILIYGPPGIGKTTCIKYLFSKIPEFSSKIMPVYVNCWSTPSKHSVYSAIAKKLGILFFGGKGSDYLLKNIIKKVENDKSIVLAFDEFDKVQDMSFLYPLFEALESRSSIIMITNNKNVILRLEDRIRSRLSLQHLKFSAYTENQILEILKERAKYSFVPGVVRPEVLITISEITSEKGDIRVGLSLMRESGRIAEKKNSDYIGLDHMEEAIKKMENLKIRSSLSNLKEEEKKVVETIKKNEGMITGNLFQKYTDSGGTLSERSFRRYLSQLNKRGFIKLEQTGTGFRGRSNKAFLKD